MKDVFLTVLFCMIASIGVMYLFYPLIDLILTGINLPGLFDLMIFFLLLVILKISLDNKRNIEK
ncbi:hypothetical protein [Oceanobacillus jeddahense]|uniref:Uncharacterized protein n=1 Tax=Oceanobacillus jeddahense TaxID=1462527 RepID=A0ABY5JX55_9BACI|nr:hypothetical protein [Oceanobacillus jeddahense]UUI04911.1 hypothetical protein NP439_09860 [Oceanobacillus jeddahense]